MAVLRRVRHFACRLEDRTWAFAADNEERIAAHWAQRRAANPALWNGTVLILDGHRFVDDTFEAAFIRTDYRAFLAWRDFGGSEGEVRNCFAMAGLRSSDGALIMGVMGAHTASPGRIYFPAGTPDLDDVVDGRVDLPGSVGRELFEETGIAPHEVELGAWLAVEMDGKLALIQEVRAPWPAQALIERVGADLARQERPELAGLIAVRRRADLDPQRMPSFILAYGESVLTG